MKLNFFSKSKDGYLFLHPDPATERITQSRIPKYIRTFLKAVTQPYSSNVISKLFNTDLNLKTDVK